MRAAAALFLVLTLTTIPSGATDCRVESAARTLPLVELFTSEGCSSCPPADRWLSSNFPPGSHGSAVALAFHVDYWDRLGWKDRFASPRYTERQYRAMRANRATFVYTPQVLLQGRDFGGWRSGSPARALGAASASAPGAAISLTARSSAREVDVEAVVTLPQPPRGEILLGLAYTESGLRSDVEAGENRGALLQHDHVVRAFETRRLTDVRTTSRLRLQRPAERGAAPLLVSFVQDAANGEVLQAVALPIEACP
jgi:hypothetical protein